MGQGEHSKFWWQSESSHYQWRERGRKLCWTSHRCKKYWGTFSQSYYAKCCQGTFANTWTAGGKPVIFLWWMSADRYNSHSSTFMHAVPDAGQDLSKLNLHAYAERVWVPSQEHKMPPVLRHCKIFAVSCVKVLVWWYNNCSTASGYNNFHPVIDGKILLDFPTSSILAGDFTKVPLIVGWVYVIVVINARIFYCFNLVQQQMIRRPVVVISQWHWGQCFLLSEMQKLMHWSRYASQYWEWIAEFIIQAYPISDFASAPLQFQTITGDSELRCAVSPIYQYHFLCNRISLIF